MCSPMQNSSYIYNTFLNFNLKFIWFGVGQVCYRLQVHIAGENLVVSLRISYLLLTDGCSNTVKVGPLILAGEKMLLVNDQQCQK